MDKTEKSEISIVRFNGKNYTSWAFQFQLYLEGKELWGFVDGSTKIPDEDEKRILSWKTKDAKIKSWVLSSVEPNFILHLRPCKTAKEMWEHLKKVYYQNHAGKQFQLEFEIANYTQGTWSIQDYYSGFLAIWSDYDEIKFAAVSEALLPELIKLQNNSHHDQLLMKLRPEYENVRSNLMSRAPLPSIDECLVELLRKEQCQMTKAILDQKTHDSIIRAAYVAKG